MSDTVRIVQLYPAELGITGDRGNARSLQVRLERGGVSAEVLQVGAGEPVPADTDILVIGNGPLSAMRSVLEDLRTRAKQLSDFVDAGGSLLAVGGSAELLSDAIEPLEGDAIEGLGVFPFRVQRTRQRKVGYILVDTPDGRVIGFEDHASRWSLDNGALPYGTVAAGRGSFEHAGAAGEIVRRLNSFATNVQGPVLPLNPQWSDVILRAATARRDIEWTPGREHTALNEYADGARSTIERLVHGKDFSSIGL